MGERLSMEVTKLPKEVAEKLKLKEGMSFKSFEKPIFSIAITTRHTNCCDFFWEAVFRTRPVFPLKPEQSPSPAIARHFGYKGKAIWLFL